MPGLADGEKLIFGGRHVSPWAHKAYLFMIRRQPVPGPAERINQTEGGRPLGVLPAIKKARFL